MSTSAFVASFGCADANVVAIDADALGKAQPQLGVVVAAVLLVPQVVEQVLADLGALGA